MVEILSDLKNYPSWLQFFVAVWVILTAIIILAWFTISPSKKALEPLANNNLTNNGNNIKYLPNPTPKDIISSVSGLPMLNRKPQLESFLGLNVKWNLYIRSVNYDYKDPQSVNISMVQEDPFVTIYCSVPLAGYPELKMIRDKTKAEVYGTISEVRPFEIVLKNVSLHIETEQ